MTIDAPTAGTLLMVLNHDSAFKSWHWPPECKAHCRHNDDFTYHFTYLATIWRRNLQIVAKYVTSNVKSSLCLQCALGLGGHCYGRNTMSWFNTIGEVPTEHCRDLKPLPVQVRGYNPHACDLFSHVTCHWLSSLWFTPPFPQWRTRWEQCM